ncbi:hypothetical protein NF27_AV00030 [Candidatus Jidaibacter acanthamoeba]|uniref:Uncharacterized protein n=1 Tax=Candidatus Jidaibacter acanthamoebae TaxID=86105 RepID=A0A0C1R1U7_9RICK|nr:hypothetical protein [Candidatus Jidaibacter acanthamoeba]KIE06240.1 hypothetical protein NF27_AV00030 [Candidatus Jidaibacter acanthamoeba]
MIAKGKYFVKRIYGIVRICANALLGRDDWIKQSFENTGIEEVKLQGQSFNK